jgi:hypothetical protein
MYPTSADWSFVTGSKGNWLAALDDFRNWLIGEAA